MTKLVTVFISALLLTVSSGTAQAQAQAQETNRLVLTSLPVTFNIATRLLQGTGIAVTNLPARGRRISGLARYFSSQSDELADTFARAEAVITLGKLWRDDPLYTAARASNIRMVEIDATQPWSTTLEGVAVATVPAPLAPWANPDEQGNNESSLWYWLSLGNTVRSLDIVAADLERLFPEQQAAIEKNQTAFRAELLSLQQHAQQALASVDDITVFSLAEELVYFISELGLFVDGSFYKQDIDWTDEDLANFRDYLLSHDIPVVLHKWEPSEQIIAAIAEAGAELVVLETLDVGIIEQGRMQPDSYLQLMGNNLAAVVAALGGVFTR